MSTTRENILAALHARLRTLVFALGTTAIAGGRLPSGTGVAAPPRALARRMVEESPYWLLVRELGHSETDRILGEDPGAGALTATGERPSADALAAELWINSGTGPAQEGVVAFAPTALLAADLSDDPEARVIAMTGWRDIGEVGIGTLASLGGDTSVQGSSSYTAPNGQPQWIDVRLSVGAEITIEFYVEGVLQTAATAANTANKGKPRHVVFANTALHGIAASRTWYYAHIAVLDGVSTIGRRFVRRSPNAIASFNQMVGSIDALKDSDIATRVASTAAGQRMSFSLTGPTGPAAISAIAGLHLKQIAQAGTNGPYATAGFLRLGGVEP